MTKFVQLPKLKSSSDVKGLQNMYDQIEISVWNLKSLDIDITTYGSLLVPPGASLRSSRWPSSQIYTKRSD